MRDAITTYFEGEKSAGLFLAAVGAVGVLAAGILFRERLGLRSYAITLAVLALVEMAIGVGLFLRTGPQVEGLRDQLAHEPARFYADERARMARVQRNFVIVEYVELGVIVAGGLIAVLLKTRPGTAGVAPGLLVTAAALLTFDVVAERRGAVYLAALTSAPSPPG